ncbi:MAG TPA: P-II family nitrogen regulator [Anaerohalosphaeraceae bacterium]|nr:P-II family nitrogen regulator [Anaerohalosphaeraceae bacterium]
MKEVIAIIRINKMNETKRALADAGIYSLTARKVTGRGRGKINTLLLKGAENGYEEAINQLGSGPRLFPKRMLTIVVPDAKVPTVVKTVIEVNKTGSPGDGKIFVQPLLDAVRIRTAEKGDKALDENNEPVKT